LQAGLQAGRWKRAKEIQSWLRQRHEKRLTIKGVYYWAGKIGEVLKVPRKTHAKKDASPSRQVSADALRTTQELERGWWQAGARVGGR
jgi:hypothetical protein